LTFIVIEKCKYGPDVYLYSYMCNYVGFCNQCVSCQCYQFGVIKTTLYVRIYLTHDQSLRQMSHKDKNVYTYCTYIYLSFVHRITSRQYSTKSLPVGQYHVCLYLCRVCVKISEKRKRKYSTINEKIAILQHYDSLPKLGQQEQL